MTRDNPWELYGSYENLSLATHEINEAVDKAYHAVIEKRCNLDEAWEEFVGPVLDKHIAGGASDSEPCNLTYNYIYYWIEDGKRPPSPHRRR